MSIPIPVRLLQLPYLAFKEVIIQLYWTEMFAISICSKRAFCFIKSLRIKLPNICLIPGYRPTEMIIGTNFVPSPNSRLHRAQTFLSIRGTEGVVNRACHVEIGGHPVLLNMHYYTWETIWNDPQLGLKVVLEHLYDLFQMNFEWIMLKKSYFSVIDLINDRETVPVKYGNVMGDYMYLDREDLENVLTNFRVELLEIDDYVGFRIELPDNFTPRPFKSLKIRSAHWLKVKNFLNFGKVCEEIEIRFTDLTSAKVKSILHHWVKGKMPALKFFKVGFQQRSYSRWRVTPPNLGAILKGLGDNLIGSAEEKHYKTHQKEIWTFPAGQGLRRNDGTIASYHLEGEYFRFAVWPGN